MAVATTWTIHAQEKKILHFSLDNDTYFSTDHYYSNGLHLAHYGPIWGRGPASHLLPAFKGIELSGLTLSHRIFTPIHKQSLTPVEGDRPFAANLLLALHRLSRSDDGRWLLSAAFSLGLSGRAALGDQVQNGVHNLLPTSGPVEGWETIQYSSFLLQYDLAMEFGLIETGFLELRPQLGLGAGNLRTDVRTGLYLRVGKLSHWRDYFFVSKVQWQCYLFGSYGWDYVFYDGNLQTIPGMKDNDYRIDPSMINRSQPMLNYGLAVEIQRLQLAFSIVHVAPEFIKAREHQWGRIALSYDF